MKTIILAGVLLGVTVPLAAQVCTFSEARARFDQLLQQRNLPGGALLIGNRQGILLESYRGNYSSNTVVAIASASKLLSGVRMLQLADRGQLNLDAPLSSYLPQFTGDKGTMTVRQMFSHTAGYGDDSGTAVMFDNTITLAQAVDQIACCRPLNAGYTVGGQFSYGGISMHIAGRVAEVAGGGDWQLQWQQNLGQPLGISSIDWQGLESTQNYGIAGSARSNLRDYGRLLHFLVNHGRTHDNQRLMRPSTVDILQQGQVGSLPIAYAPINAGAVIRYGMGSWHEPLRPSSEEAFIHSLGAFGFFPWIDFKRDTFGVFMIRGLPTVNNTAFPIYNEMLRTIALEVDANACQSVENFAGIFAGDFES
jgi:CubicO group peptidase (beta-lactamase class C family)